MITNHIWPASLFHEMIASAVSQEIANMHEPAKSEMNPELVELAWRIALLDIAMPAGNA